MYLRTSAVSYHARMLWNYVSVGPMIIAIVNTVIAVYSSQFEPEQRFGKLALLVTSIILGLVASIATIAGQHHVLSVQEEAIAKVASLTANLPELINSTKGTGTAFTGE